MANVLIFSGNFFHFVKMKKYAFQMMVNNFRENLGGNNYHQISVVIVTTEIFP